MDLLEQNITPKPSFLALTSSKDILSKGKKLFRLVGSSNESIQGYSSQGA